jgi:23S rRNA G2445 N2-methylase RlmL
MRDDAQAAIRPYRGVIVASDTDREAVDATRANIAAAGLADVVIARNADARKVEPLLGGGMFVCNPPYGERIGGDDDEIETLYDALASRFATCPDNPLAILGLRDRLEPHFGAADRTLHVLNGKLRCEFSVWS